MALCFLSGRPLGGWLDLAVDDIDRIEVVRGPGGTLWGANAVNGVINVVTRHSEETLGMSATTIAGNTDRMGALRYGSRVASKATFRVRGKYTDRKEFDAADEHYPGGGWNAFRTGFRLDTPRGSSTDWMIQGEVHGVSSERQDIAARIGTTGPVLLPTAEHRFQGGFLQARGQRSWGSGLHAMAQVWYTREDRDERVFGELRDTADFEAQLTREGHSNTITVGVNHRWSRDELRSSDTYAFTPPERTLRWSSIFAQHELLFGAGRARLSTGGKFEHNDYTGWEVQPTLKLGVDAGRAGFVWTSASRAVRTPSRSYTSIRALRAVAIEEELPLPIVGTFTGSEDLPSENLQAFEIGWRRRFGERLFVDATAFHNRYDDLLMARVFEPVLGMTPQLELFLDTPIELAGGGEGTARGIETVFDFRLDHRNRVVASYSYIDMEIDLGQVDSANLEIDRSALTNNTYDTPSHQAFVRWSFGPARGWSWDLAARWSDALAHNPSEFITRPPVGSVADLHARLAWQATNYAQIEIIGRHLLDSERVEFYDNTDIYPTAEIPRQVFVKLNLTY